MLHTDNQDRTFQLLESMLLDDGIYFLLDAHLNRMKKSAAYFHMPYNEGEVVASLVTHATKHHIGRRKVRLLLNDRSQITIESEQLQDVEPNPQTVLIATKPIDHTNIFHYHKTTNRSIYTCHHNAQTEDYFDILLWNTAEEITECTIGNIVLEKNGVKYTPPIISGTLAGTFRNHLLKSQEIQERTITLNELKDYQKTWLINSVRGWIPIKITEI